MVTPKRNKREQGFTLVTTAVCAFALLGVMGLSIDLGRLYVAKNEAQTFADLTALAACKELNATAAGVANAVAKVTTSEMSWNFRNNVFENPIIEFSKSPMTGGWVNAAMASADPVGVVGVRVTVAPSNIGLFFIPAVSSQTTGSVAARAVAGQFVSSSYPPSDPIGTIPFSPIVNSTPDPANGQLSQVTEADWGYKGADLEAANNTGTILTLRWPSGINGNKTFCPGETPQSIIDSTADGTSARGYIQMNSASDIRDAIEGDRVDNEVREGYPVDMVTGVKATEESALENRAESDTDTTSSNYWEYMNNKDPITGERVGNGRRIGLVPIHNPYDGNMVVGFAEVFLPMLQDKSGNTSLCAEYIGAVKTPGDGGGSSGGGSEANVKIRLLE